MADIALNVSAQDKASPVMEAIRASAVRAAGDVSSAYGQFREDYNDTNTVMEKLGVVAASVSGVVATAFQSIKEEMGPVAEQAKNMAERFIALQIIKEVAVNAAKALGVVFALYEATKLYFALSNGAAYKNADIDVLVKTNDAVVLLQHSLQLTAVDANVLSETMKRLAVNSGDYTTVSNDAVNSIRTNNAELDRLGIAYKDVNGHLLTTREVVANVKVKLDEYSDGWDRNHAATAIGMGTYPQINAYLKVTQDELIATKSRLDDFNLGIGTDTQMAITQYQKAVRELNDENRLMGEGFKRVIADNIMPILTMLAEYFKSSANDIIDWDKLLVNSFRAVLATITTLILGFKSSFDMVYNVIEGALKSFSALVGGVFSGVGKALKGDFVGAAEVMLAALDKAEAQRQAANDKTDNDLARNFKAMQIAQGTDNRADGNGGNPVTAGKPWVAATADTSDADFKIWLDMQTKELEAFKSLRLQETAFAKGQGELELDALKNRNEQGLISEEDYLKRKYQITENTAQKEFEVAAQYLEREKTLLADVLEGAGADSTEYLAELQKHNSAVQAMQQAQMNVAKTYMNNQNEQLKLAMAEHLRIVKNTLEERLKAYKDHNEVFLKREGEKYTLLKKMEDDQATFIKSNIAILDQEMAKYMTAWKTAYDTITGIETARNKARADAAKAGLSDFQKEQQAIQGLIDRQGKLSDISDPTARIAETAALAQGWDDIATAVDGDINKVTIVEQNIAKLKQTEHDLGIEHMASLVDQKNKMTDLWGAAQQKANEYQRTLDLIKGGLEALNNSTIKIGFQITGLDQVQSVIDMANRASGLTGSSTSGGAIIPQSFSSLPLSFYGGGRASGGPVDPYATYRINEDGTEYLTMGSKGGYITPHGTTPAQQNAPSGGITIAGDIVINAGTTSDPKQLARVLYGELQQLGTRYRQ